MFYSSDHIRSKLVHGLPLSHEEQLIEAAAPDSDDRNHFYVIVHEAGDEIVREIYPEPWRSTRFPGEIVPLQPRRWQS